MAGLSKLDRYACRDDTELLGVRNLQNRNCREAAEWRGGRGPRGLPRKQGACPHTRGSRLLATPIPLSRQCSPAIAPYRAVTAPAPRPQPCITRRDAAVRHHGRVVVLPACNNVPRAAGSAVPDLTHTAS